MTLISISIQSKGGPGSGNWGHRGIPGKVGGSSPRGAGMSPTSGKDWLQRYEKRAGKKHPSASKPKPVPVVLNASTPGTNIGDSKANAMLNSGTSKEWESATTDERTTMKAAIVDTIAQQSGVNADTVNSVLKRWSISSNDGNPESLSMQEAVSEEFNTPLSDWQKSKIAEVNASSKGSVTGITSRENERAISKAVYNNTQAELRKAGYKPGDSITLYRGMDMNDRDDRRSGSTESYSGNVVESWSVSVDVAEQFMYSMSEGLQGITLSMDVPIESIFSTAATGLGCLTEGEFILFGNIPGSEALIELTY